MEGSETIPQGSRPEAGPKRETECLCTQCQQTKPIEQFDRYRPRGGYAGPQLLRKQCQTCVRTRRYWWFIATKYSVSKDQFMSMLSEQRGLCAICKCSMDTARFKRPCVDHCHKTGKVRGLLCQSCNIGIGMLKDSPIRLKAAIEYLERHKPSDDMAPSSGQPEADSPESQTE